MALPSAAGPDAAARGAGADPARLKRDLIVRKSAAVGCAAVTAGLVVTVAARLAMSLLASLNPEDAGVRSDDGFVIGQVTVSGTGQLAAAVVQLACVGAALYLLLRPFLLGTGVVRVVTSSIGFGVTIAAIIVHPAGVDFTLLEPLWLSVAVFIALPIVAVALFSTLAEVWLRDRSWFMNAPRSHVRPWLALWIFAGVGLIVLVPTFAVALVVASGVGRDPWIGEETETGPGITPSILRLGQAALVGIAGVATLALAGDVSAILG